MTTTISYNQITTGTIVNVTLFPEIELFVVIAEEHPDSGGYTGIVGIFTDEKRANAIAEKLEDEWEARTDVSHWSFNFSVRKTTGMDIQHITHTYGLAPRLDKATDTFVDYPPTDESNEKAI